MSGSLVLFLEFLAGVTLAFAVINITIGLQKGSEKTYLILGVISACVGIYYLLFPQMTYADSSRLITNIGLFFFLVNFALLPWFFCYYTSYCKFRVQWLLTIGMTISYLVFVFTTDFGQPKIWNILAHITLVGIIVFGFKAAFYQRKFGDKRSANLLIGSLVVFAILSLDDIIRMHFPAYYPFDMPANLLPFDYFLLVFLVIMGVKLASDIQQRYQMQKSIIEKEQRWGDLLKKVHLLVVGLGKDGCINHLNPYFLELTGFNSEDLIGNHYSTLLPESERESLIGYINATETPLDGPYYQNNILTKEGEEKSISWSLVSVYDESGDFVSSITIGSDVTDRQRAYEEIHLLKSKLEEENVVLKAELNEVRDLGELTGNSDAMRYVLQRANQVAGTDATVLLEGETGVGKELVANYIQKTSLRSDKPFIKINCATIPENLLESELFGHLKGAFTGADRNKRGLVEVANGGTLFLDEIGDFPFELQAKLLRFLQEGEYLPLGAEATRTSDVRIIAATNHELLKLIENRVFRSDLYYRLYVYPITIPALRNRADDIPEFVDHFVKLYARKHNKTITKVSKLVIDDLKRYDWPGNVRELENTLERAVIVSDSNTIKLKDISLFKANEKSKPKLLPGQFNTLEALERDHITAVLKHCHWQVHGPKGAAQILGINPSTLRSRMKKLEITRP